MNDSRIVTNVVATSESLVVVSKETLEINKEKESRTNKNVENGITFDFYGLFLRSREEALEEIESGSRIHSFSHGQFNVRSALLHVPAWPDNFSLFPEFPCHDASSSKSLNYSQSVDVIRSRL